MSCNMLEEDCYNPTNHFCNKVAEMFFFDLITRKAYLGSDFNFE